MLWDAPILALFALLAFCIVKLIVNLATGGSRRGFLIWSAIGAVISLALYVTQAWGLDLTWTILVPPVLINAGILYLFARTLLPGREPLLTRFRRLCDGWLTPEISLYTRRWTVFWVIFLACSTAISLLAALYADWATWSWIVNIACPATALSAFLGEHLYRMRFLGHFGPASVPRTLRTMLRPDAWSLEAPETSTAR